MKKVFKYKERMNDTITFLLPEGAEILHVDVQEDDEQQGMITLWALVNPRQSVNVSRHIRIAGTGHPIDDKLSTYTHINTFTMAGRTLWFHAFEDKKKRPGDGKEEEKHHRAMPRQEGV